MDRHPPTALTSIPHPPARTQNIGSSRHVPETQGRSPQFDRAPTGDTGLALEREEDEVKQWTKVRIIFVILRQSAGRKNLPADSLVSCTPVCRPFQLQGMEATCPPAPGYLNVLASLSL